MRWFCENEPSVKRVATTKAIVRLAREVKWREVRSPEGKIVEPQTIREMLEYAAASQKRKRTSKRAQAAVA